jgi:large subunit ribosomal protein L21
MFPIAHATFAGSALFERGFEARCGSPLGEWRGWGFIERADMYAVIKTGGKQYKVAAGEKIKVEQIAADVGQEIVIDQILAVGNGAELKIGTPLVAGASITATVVAHGRHDKVRIFKLRRRKHYKKSQGHRQNFTELEISAVNG